MYAQCTHSRYKRHIYTYLSTVAHTMDELTIYIHPIQILNKFHAEISSNVAFYKIFYSNMIFYVYANIMKFVGK